MIDRLRGRSARGTFRRLGVAGVVLCFLVSGLAGFKPGQAHAAMHIDEPAGLQSGQVEPQPGHAHHASHGDTPLGDHLHAPEQCQLERHCAATCAQGSSLLPAARGGPLPGAPRTSLRVADEAPPAEPDADRLLRPPRILLTA
ncbi:MAG: hypothetical protein JJT85_01640 [Chromatiales bacterium]|nr:hypothetical protein [Chromatiales bacterium]